MNERKLWSRERQADTCGERSVLSTSSPLNTPTHMSKSQHVAEPGTVREEPCPLGDGPLALESLRTFLGSQRFAPCLSSVA